MVLRNTFLFVFLASNTYMETGFLVFDKKMLILNFVLLAHAEMNSWKH